MIYTTHIFHYKSISISSTILIMLAIQLVAILFIQFCNDIGHQFYKKLRQFVLHIHVIIPTFGVLDIF